MDEAQETVIPVLPLATEDVALPQVATGEPMTAERLSELRGALAVMADQPIATLEIRPMTSGITRADGIALSAASPLAQQLSQLIRSSAEKSSTVASSTANGENLYRMVVPAKVAREFGSGVVKPMTNRSVPGGISGVLRGPTNIVGHAAFVPVKAAAGAGVAGSAGAAAGTAVAGGAAAAAFTVAAPLVLMTIAVGVSANADAQRERAIEHITELLEGMSEEKLADERSELNGCGGAIRKATTILLDHGKIGMSLGLDSAVHAIDTALSRAEDRLNGWKTALAELPEEEEVEISQLQAFGGIEEEGGEFRTQLDIAALAIALKRRVIVLQAVEHAQSDEGNVFRNFSRELKADQERIDQLEAEIRSILLRLSSLQLRRKRGVRSAVFTGGAVDRLLHQASRIRSLAEQAPSTVGARDVTIDIARRRDGSVVVLPAALV
jgi:hypothetical protein